MSMRRKRGCGGTPHKFMATMCPSSSPA